MNIKKKVNKKGIFTIEYAAFITSIVIAAIVMHGYIQRAVSGAWKRYADSIGSGLQYDPGVTYIYRSLYSDDECRPTYPWS